MQSRIMQGLLATVLAVGFTVIVAVNASAKDEQKEKENAPQKVSMADLPAAVRATVEKLTAGGEIKKMDKETEDGKVVYDVEATVNGKDMEFDIAADGTTLGTEESVEYGSLPSVVRGAAEKYFGSATGLKASKTFEGGKTGYEVGGKKDGKKVSLALDETGKILEEEKD